MAKYKRCCACDFWVTASDHRCPNCGIAEPRQDRPMNNNSGVPNNGGDVLTMETPMTDGTRAAFGGFIGAVIGGFLMEGMGVAVGVAVGVSLGVLLGADRDWQIPDSGGGGQSANRRKAGRSLRQDEETIQQRLADIAGREKRIGEMRQKVAKEAQIDSEPTTEFAERWKKVSYTLDSAHAILSRHRERYHAALWEIALARWQNTLEPLAADWETLTHETCNHRLRLLEAARDRGQAFLAEWEGIDLTEMPEGAHSVARLKQALETCEQLREALIVQQAALAVKGIAPMDEALQPALVSSDALQSLDIFNARAAIGEFTSAFGELEAEYARLRSEEELAERTVMVQRLR